MMYYMGYTYHTYDVHCPYHTHDVRFPDPLAHDLYLTDLDTNLSQSPGPGQAKPEPSPGWWLWPGLGFSKAKATLGQAKARASRPKPGRNITRSVGIHAMTVEKETRGYDYSGTSRVSPTHFACYGHLKRGNVFRRHDDTGNCSASS